MPRVPLVSGAYQSRSLIAGAQRCVNLYPESNQKNEQAPVPVTHYPTAGTTLYYDNQVSFKCRCLYRTSLGKLYAVIGQTVYIVVDQPLTNTAAAIPIGTIDVGESQVYMTDNGLCAVLTDGSAFGYAIDLQSNLFGKIVSPNWHSADFCVYIDTFFIFNRKGTNQFFISDSMANFSLLTTISVTNPNGAFDPLDVAAKSGSGDPIVSISTTHNDLWLIGELTTEIWNGTGSADFYFQRQGGSFIDHGIAAKYSIGTQDIFNFWVMRDRQGDALIVEGANYQVKEISTSAITTILKTFPTIDDAIGYTYQYSDHAFYVVTFPSGNRTFAFELNTRQWHELAWLDINGGLNRHRGNCAAFAFGKNIIGDWETGNLFVLNPDVFTDAGAPIPRIRTFPHMIQDGKRVMYKQFIIDMQTGTIPTEDTNQPPLINLRWSDDRGVTYGNAVQNSIGKTGEYLTQISFWRLGTARDRVFEISWSAPIRTALNGAFVEVSAVSKT